MLQCVSPTFTRIWTADDNSRDDYRHPDVQCIPICRKWLCINRLLVLREEPFCPIRTDSFPLLFTRLCYCSTIYISIIFPCIMSVSILDIVVTRSVFPMAEVVQLIEPLEQWLLRRQWPVCTCTRPTLWAPPIYGRLNTALCRMVKDNTDQATVETSWISILFCLWFNVLVLPFAITYCIPMIILLWLLT